MMLDYLSQEDRRLSIKLVFILISIVVVLVLVGGCISKNNKISSEVTKQAINNGLEECPKVVGCGTVWVKSCKDYRN